ncbi:site-specific integrase [Candidatus Woesearchaeota archaeon]|nr:site-specific integrase [Candidatus Woesearchaeota archaeon]
MSLKVHNEGIIDPHGNKKKYENWVKDGRLFSYVSGQNRELISRFMQDMESGYNINLQKKGGRSYSRLNALRVRLPQIAGFFQTKYKKELSKLTPKEVVSLFNEMEKGKLKKKDGNSYKSWKDYVKDFKSFWHWYMRYMKREKQTLIEDITEELDGTSIKKRDFVYVTHEELKKLADNAKFEYKVLLWFLFDSGVRAPQEAANIKVSDITDAGEKEPLMLDVRDEISKTFGRKIKLMLSSNLIRRYIKENNLAKNDFLFRISPRVKNQYIKRLGEVVLKKKGLTMYDFRHASACYWLPRYKTQSALMYRFGWKNPEMIEYYSQFLGMKDSITSDDLEDSETRTELQKAVEQERNQRQIMEERMNSMQQEMETWKHEITKIIAADLKKKLKITA